MGNFDKIVNLCKNRGFIFPGSDIYDGLANTWDYGPVGVELKNNIKRAWWKKFVQEAHNSFGIDADIFLEGLSDPRPLPTQQELALSEQIYELYRRVLLGLDTVSEGIEKMEQTRQNWKNAV